MKRKLFMSSSLMENFHKKLNKSSTIIEDSVIVIKENGEVIKETLGGKPYNHGILTNYLAMKLGCDYLEDNSPYFSGINLSNQGYVVMQIDVDQFCDCGLCLCFFPSSVSNFQILSVIEIVESLENVCYQYLGNLGDDYLPSQEFLLYVNSLKEKIYRRSRFKDKTDI